MKVAVEASYWMDRVKTVGDAKRPRTVTLVSVNRDSHDQITARVALTARRGLSQDELYQWARERRQAVMQANRPRLGLVTMGLLAAGIALSVAGSAMTSQVMVMCGFGIAFAGVLVGCTILAALLDPQLGDLAKYIRADEVPATADEIATLSRTAQADPELDKLIAGWWKDSGAPIRKQDLALVQALLESRQGS